MSKIKRIIFLDSKSDVESYKDTGANGVYSEGDLLIALSPSVYVYAQKSGFAVHNTLRYFTVESHSRSLERSKAISDWIRKNFDPVDLNMGVKRAYVEVLNFLSRFAVHRCLWIIEIVLNAAEAHQPQVLCASLQGSGRIDSLYIEPQEKYSGRLVRAIAEKMGLRFEEIFSKTGDIDKTSRPDSGLYGALKFFVKLIRFKLWKRKIVLANVFNRSKRVFFTTRFYSLDKLAGQLRERYPDKEIQFLQGPVLMPRDFPRVLAKLCVGKYNGKIGSQRRLLDVLASEIAKEKKLFSHRGVVFADVISKKIKDNLADFIVALISWTVELNDFLGISKAAVFISNGNRSDDFILAELCEKKNVQTILISHGSHVCPKDEYEAIEWGEHGKLLLRAPFSHLALQSPLAEGYLGFFPSESEIIKTGPLIWGRPVDIKESELLFSKMFNGKIKDTRVIVHAGTPKPTNSLRPYVYETPDEYINALRDLAGAVENIPGAVLIIKFRPLAEISVDDIKAFIPFSKKVILSIEEPFIKVLGMADLLVSFSSTTIEEAMQNRIPVLLYGGSGRYCHIPAYEIALANPVGRSAVYHVKEAKDLNYAISRILELNIAGSAGSGSIFNQYIYDTNYREPLV